jgi:hypothetical protein
MIAGFSHRSIGVQNGKQVLYAGSYVSGQSVSVSDSGFGSDPKTRLNKKEDKF